MRQGGIQHLLFRACILGAALIGLTLTARAERIQFYYDEDPLSDISASAIAQAKEFYNYKLPMTKRDIVIVGTHITIDQLLRTDGGNVFILADTLTMNAPIDTRVWSTVNPPYWRVRPDYSSLQDLYDKAPEAMRPFFNWYFWFSSYDPNEHQFKFVTGNETDFSHEKLQVPLLPFGRVEAAQIKLPPWEGMSVNSSQDPSPDGLYRLESFKSGNVTIFARAIEFCKDCISTSSTGTRADGGKETERNQAIFFNAGGLPSGRGGLGSPFPRCINANLNGFGIDCDSHDVANRPGGRSSLDGLFGSGAGTISFNIVDNPGFTANENLLRRNFLSCLSSACSGPGYVSMYGKSLAALSNTRGAARSHTGYIATPSFASLIAAHGSRTVFNEGPPILPEVGGPYGDLIIQDVSPEQAFSITAATLSRFDAETKYDLRRTLDWMVGEGAANTGDLVASSTPIARRMLTSFIAKLVESRQSALVQTLEARVSPNGDTPILWNDFIKSYSCRGIGLLDIEELLLRRACEQTLVDGMGGLRGYFTRVGGLLKVYDAFGRADLNEEAILAGMIGLTKAVGNLRLDVQNQTTILERQITSDIRDRMTTSLAKLDEALANARSKLEKAQNATNESILVPLQHLVKDTQDDVKEVAAGYASGNYIAIIPGIYNIGVNVGKFYSGDEFKRLNQEAVAADEAVIAALAELEKMRSAYADFEHEYTIQQEQARANQLGTLKEVMDASYNLDMARLRIHLHFEDMVRAALIGFVADKSTFDGGLLNHAAAIRGILSNFPNISPVPLAEIAASGTCAANATPLERLPQDLPVGCASLSSPARSSVLISKANQRLPLFPLVVRSSEAGSYTLSLQFLYSPGELEWIAATALH